VYLDAPLKAARYGAKAGVEAVYALDLGLLFFGHRQPIVSGDALDHQDAVAVEHLADGLHLEAVALDCDLTRLQRACKSAGQSAPRGGNYVVKRRSMRWIIGR
jgi:N-acetylglucosamine-6-phosphate deacetylase